MRGFIACYYNVRETARYINKLIACYYSGQDTQYINKLIACYYNTIFRTKKEGDQ